jgi:hypothetical protein
MDKSLSLKMDGRNLILIVGAPRSGTTWLQKLMASHPRLKTGQETDIFDVYIGPQLRAWRMQSDDKRSGRGGVGLGCYFHEEEFLRNLSDYLAVLLKPVLGSLRDDEYFVEKTPGHALYIPEILELMPKVRIIHILRDGRDVVASLLAASRDWGKNWAPPKANAAAYMWVKHVRAVRASAHLIPSGQFYELRYEDLFLDPLASISSIFQFLNIPWSDAGLKDAVERNRPDALSQANATVIPLSGEFGDKSGPVVQDPPRFIRRATPGGWRTDLSFWEKLQVWKIARNMLKQNGYRW